MELHKYILTLKLPGIIEDLSYICVNLPNRTETYGDNIYWSFRKYVRTNKPPLLTHILSNENHNVINDDVINGNETSTNDQVYGSNGELLKNWVL